MNLAYRDIRHNLGRFLLTCFGLSLLLGVVLSMIGIYRGLVEDALTLLSMSGSWNPVRAGHLPSPPVFPEIRVNPSLGFRASARQAVSPISPSRRSPAAISSGFMLSVTNPVVPAALIVLSPDAQLAAATMKWWLTNGPVFR